MPARHSCLAVLLLLCFVRTLLPEAWILALHSHAHTTEEPARALAVVRRSMPLLCPPHQHCEVEKFYNAAFQPAVPVAFSSFRLAPPYAAPAAGLAERDAAGQVVRAWVLRGPPACV